VLDVSFHLNMLPIAFPNCKASFFFWSFFSAILEEVATGVSASILEVLTSVFKMRIQMESSGMMMWAISKVHV